jgi:hypothetical protein
MKFNLYQTIDNFDIVDETFEIDNSLPGIGQLVQDTSFVVPLHNFSNLTTLEKKLNLDSEQTGAGLDNQETNLDTGKDTIDNETETNKDYTKKEKAPLEFNEQKRKHMDEGVYESFLNSKMFKTNSIKLSPKAEKSKQQNVSGTGTSSNTKKITENIEKKSVKHKFNVF